LTKKIGNQTAHERFYCNEIMQREELNPNETVGVLIFRDEQSDLVGLIILNV
jgi:hypothetical protein